MNPYGYDHPSKNTMTASCGADYYIDKAEILSDRADRLCYRGEYTRAFHVRRRAIRLISESISEISAGVDIAVSRGRISYRRVEP